MGILSRIFRLCKADVHGVMDQLEDKGLLLKQYLREMESSLKEKEQRLAQIGQRLRQVQRDLNQRREEVDKLEKDLNLAVLKEKDDIARMLIRKRRTLEESCEQLKYRMEGLAEEKSKLEETLAHQRLQHEQLKIKAASFCQKERHQELAGHIGLDQGTPSWKAPTEEEIELELLQRKEALQQGGGA